MKHWKKHDINFSMAISVTELWRRRINSTIKWAIVPKLPSISQTVEAMVLFLNCLILFLHIWYFRELYTIKTVKMIGKSGIFNTSIRMWTYRDINITIYPGTAEKWYNIVIKSLILHMPSRGLILRCRLSKASEHTLCRLPASQTLPQF